MFREGKVLSYPGAKWRITNRIIDRMPTHKSYLEPYFGSDAVFSRKVPSRIETINDLKGCTCLHDRGAKNNAYVIAF